jgi:protein SCO1/2
MNKLAILSLAGLVLATPLARQPAMAQEAHHHHDHHAMEGMTQPVSGQSLYNLSGQWTTQDGNTVGLASLAGQPVILAMAYTSCKEMCPLTVETMRKIALEWAKRSKAPVKLVFFSFDTDRDTPGHLKEYAEARGLDPAQWTLFHGDASAVRELAAALGISYRKQDNGDFDHGYAITLLDQGGVIAYQQTGLTQDNAEWMEHLGKVTARVK